ncbi:MAG: S26 family signal peptidase [Clostridia bacterium]|nr:S26 family signal peptidase [Clostridia bacterium]
MEEFVIPQGYLFVMGDHRNVSLDSEDFGIIDERAVVGKVFMRLRPFTIFK